MVYFVKVTFVNILQTSINYGHFKMLVVACCPITILVSY